MKNIFLALFLFSSTVIVNAQDIYVESNQESIPVSSGNGSTDKSTSQSGSFLNCKVELGGQFSLSGAKYQGDDNSITVFLLEPYVGFNISKGFEMGIYPGLSSVSGGSNSRTAYQIFLAPAYTFDGGNTYPFIEGLVGYSNSDIGLSGIGYGARAGLKIQIGNSSLISVGFSFVQQNLSSTNDRVYTENVGTYMFDVGFRVFL